MTNFEGYYFFNHYRLLGMFPSQITFTKKAQSGNIKFIQNLSPFGIADFAESAALFGSSDPCISQGSRIQGGRV